MEVPTTVVEHAQAGLRQGFRWLGEIVHRTIGVGPGKYQIDFLLVVPSPLPSRTSPPGQAQSVGSAVGPIQVLDAPFFVGRTPTGRYGTVFLAGATASVEEAASSKSAAARASASSGGANE